MAKSGKGAVAAPKMPVQGPSLRDKNKEQTRHALRQAALRLFAAQGFDATTTAEIAATAGVATRTLFRYFPNKEHIVYHGEQEWLRDFVASYPAQPAPLSEIDAMRLTLVGLTRHFARSKQSMRLYKRAVESSPTLRGHEQAHYDDTVAIVAQAIASRRGRRQADETCILLASVSLLVYRRAQVRWLAGPANASLAKEITKEFKLLQSLFTQ